MGLSRSRSMISEDTKTFLDGKIGGKKVVVFSKPGCPYCTKAEKVLKKYNLSEDELDIIEISNRSDCCEIQDYLKEITGARSVSIFIML